MEQVDAVVIGAGVVGLAVARELAMAGREVLVLEAAGAIGTETSSRNSEVIHAGIYYPTGSLKARSCVAGKRLLYDYCAGHGVPHRRCGKLIVATGEAQRATLEGIRAKAVANGVDDLRWLDRAAIRALEPEVEAVAALLSPSTGIVDSHGLMLAYRGEAEDHGAMIAFHAPVSGGSTREGGIELAVGGREPMRLRARSVVNSAGLHAPTLARTIEGLPPELIPPAYFCKGNYYTLSGARPFSHLVYPVPEEAGLGIHVTIDLAGQVRFGPDVEWVERIDYDVDPWRATRFYEAIRQYYPGLKDGAIEPGYAGIRPKIAPKGTQAADFVVQGPAEHGVPGLVNLFAIESPGLTSSLVLAREAVAALGQPVTRGGLMARVASIGECMIELRHRGETKLDLGFGGDTLNFAVYLARLARGRQLSVDYVTALGDDPYSDMMLAGWRAEGVGCELVARLAGRLPGLHTIRTDAQGERTFTYWRSASAARDVLKGAHGERIVEQLASYDLLYLSGITLSILDAPQRATLIELADRVRARGGRVAFDSNFRPAGWPDRGEARAAFDAMLRRVDIALPTLDDDQALFGVKDAAECARRLHGLGVAEVAVKLGAKGCWLSLDGRGAPVPAEPVARVVDSTAAGDSFNAGYLAARLSGALPDVAAMQGHRIAARVIGHPGAVIPPAAMADLMPSAA